MSEPRQRARVATAAALLLALPAAVGFAEDGGAPAKPSVVAPEGLPRMGQDVLRATVPPYPHQAEDAVPVGDTLEAHGVPMNVMSFMTDDPPRQVLDFYEAYFAKAKLPMVGNGDIGNRFPYPSVTVMDQANEVDISIICVPNPDHRTMVLVARSDLKPLLDDLGRAKDRRWGGLPPYPGADDASASTFQDGEHRSGYVGFSTADAPAQVIAFYKKALAGAEVEDDAGGTTFRLPGGVWHLSAKPDAAKRTQVSAVHYLGPRERTEDAWPHK